MTIQAKSFHLIFVFALALVCGVAFFNALHNAFMIDDHNVILWDFRGHNPHYLLDQFIPDYRDLRGMKDLSVSQYFRPWAHVIPLACYSFFRDDPFGYHVTNLVLFYFACLSIYFFLNFLLKDRLPAALTAVFFAVHPMNGLMVNYITASVFSFQLIATMLGLMAFLKYADDSRRWMWLVPALFAFLNSLLCHETALAFPFYAGLCLWFRRKTFQETLRLSWPIGAAAGIYFLFRLKTISLQSSILENIFLMDVNLATYLATFAKLLAWYFHGLITLQGIVLIKAIAVESTGAGWWIAGLMAASAAGFFLIKFVLDARERLALVWLAIGFLPAMLACFFQFRAGLILEPHWLVVGSIGYFLFLTLILMRLNNMYRGMLLAVIVSMLVIWQVKTGWSYNRLWGNEIQYCLNWMGQSPTIRPIKIYLGHAYLKQNNLSEAKSCFVQALGNGFFDYEVFNNLGGIAMKEGEWKTAEDDFRRALVFHPESGAVHNNLGVVYFNEGQDEQAEQSYKEALRVNPFLMDARKNLASLYVQQGRENEAIGVYEESLNIDPFHQESLALLIEACLKTSRKDKLQPLVRRLVQTGEDSRLLLNTAVRLAESGEDRLAVDCFEKALKVDPDSREVYAEFGKFLGNMNRFDEAIAVWKEGLLRHPSDDTFLQLIARAEELKTNASHEKTVP